MRQQQLIRVLMNSQIYHEQAHDIYAEFMSKNNQHRFKDINASNKEVKVYTLLGSYRYIYGKTTG